MSEGARMHPLGYWDDPESRKLHELNEMYGHGVLWGIEFGLAADTPVLTCHRALVDQYAAGIKRGRELKREHQGIG